MNPRKSLVLVLFLFVIITSLPKIGNCAGDGVPTQERTTVLNKTSERIFLGFRGGPYYVILPGKDKVFEKTTPDSRARPLSDFEKFTSLVSAASHEIEEKLGYKAVITEVWGKQENYFVKFVFTKKRSCR
jgi:hypothetical protein